MSRRTIYHWIATGQVDLDLDEEPVRYRSRPPVPTKLDPYKGIITARLDAFPALTAQWLFDEVRAAGSPGGDTPVKASVRQVPAAVARRTGGALRDAPRLSGPGGLRDVHPPVGASARAVDRVGLLAPAVAAVLPAPNDGGAESRGLEAAVTSVGGVPQELLFAQMRSVVTGDGRPAEGGLVMNAEFLRFAEHGGFRARACRPYRAHTKGTVERPSRYCRQSFFYGRTFVGDDDLAAQAAPWWSRHPTRRGSSRL